jgi:CDP-diacylglycerol--glycerol-3-phosphate 3-phosphatidyltransferase
LVSFILAAFSDWLDGHLARKLGLVTSLGKLLDPLADKILVSSAFIFFSSEGLCPVWVTAVIIAREFLVTGLRQIAVEKGKVIAADNLGKWKTTFQLTFGITTLVWLIFSPTGPHGALGNFFETLSNPENWLFKISLWGALGLTLLSGWNYLNQSRSLLRE